MRVVITGCCAGLSIILAGCSSLSAIFKDNDDPPPAVVEIKPALTVKTAWSVPIGKSDRFSFSPIMAGNSIYAAAKDGTLMRVNAASGQIIWRINAGSSLTAGAGSDGNTVVVAAEKGVVLAFDGQGKLRWKAQASSEIITPPVVGQGVVIIRSMDNRIVAYDAEAGIPRWNIQRPIPPLMLRSAAGITIAQTSAFAALPAGKLLSIDLSNGEIRWEAVLSLPGGATELERIVDISGAPVIHEEAVLCSLLSGARGLS